MAEQHFDFIIAGGGAAGLSLAYHLILSPLRNRSILIVDKDDDDQMQRNWGFWTNQPTVFERVVDFTWNQLQYVTNDGEWRIDLGDYRYKLMRGAHFYRFVLEQLAACPNVTFVRGVIHNITDDANAAYVTVNENTYSGRWVFDSIVRLPDLKRELTRSHSRSLRMHFKGWEIEAPRPAFDPGAARLFDFRAPHTPQPGAMRFFYLLPFSASRAFIEYTLFSANVLKQDEYEQGLKHYIADTLGIHDYRVLSEENGAVALTDYRFPRRTGQHIMTIGTKAGRVKPSTGYSFMRVQKDAEAIVQSLLRAAHPFDVRPDPYFFQQCDSLMLQIMDQHGEQVERIFTALFLRNPIQRVLCFLDDVSTPLENFALIASLPPRLFLQAIIQRQLKHFPLSGHAHANST
jgi:lycopene beta-cyclase